MRRIISLIIALAFLAPLANAYYEVTERVEVVSVNATTKNVVIKRKNSDDKWLLHYSGKCKEMEEGEGVILVVRSDLDGYGDYLKSNPYYRCTIDQAEIITGTLNIDRAYQSGTSAVVTDKNGDQFRIHIYGRCRSLMGYNKRYIYHEQLGSTPRTGDMIYLPRNEGRCSISYISPIEDYEEKEVRRTPDSSGEELGDIRRPNMINEVDAVPGNGKVYLSWKAPYENVAIDHYIISYGEYQLYTKEYSLSEMPNKIITEKNSYTLNDLENEETYYFYVIAVDTSDNMASHWSPTASTTTRSSIPKTMKTDEDTSLVIRKTQETTGSILLQWNKKSSAIRQTVILETDGEREFAYVEWKKKFIRVLKRDHRKGKDLKLIVRNYDIHGGMSQDEYNFSF